MKLDLKTLEELVKNLNEHNIESLELDLGTEKLYLKIIGNLQEESPVLQETVVLSSPIEAIIVEEEIQEENKKVVSSPMAGIIYRASAPGKEAFVQEGDVVKVGDTLCIVEAMKMMNEVKSTQAGTIVKILVGDGMVVQKEQVLFEIK